MNTCMRPEQYRPGIRTSKAGSVHPFSGWTFKLSHSAPWRSAVYNVFLWAHLSTCSCKEAEVGSSLLNHPCVAPWTVRFFQAWADSGFCVWSPVKGLLWFLGLHSEKPAERLVPESGQSKRSSPDVVQTTPDGEASTSESHFQLDGCKKECCWSTVHRSTQCMHYFSVTVNFSMSQTRTRHHKATFDAQLWGRTRLISAETTHLVWSQSTLNSWTPKVDCSTAFLRC